LNSLREYLCNVTKPPDRDCRLTSPLAYIMRMGENLPGSSMLGQSEDVIISVVSFLDPPDIICFSLVSVRQECDCIFSLTRSFRLAGRYGIFATSGLSGRTLASTMSLPGVTRLPPPLFHHFRCRTSSLRSFPHFISLEGGYLELLVPNGYSTSLGLRGLLSLMSVSSQVMMIGCC